MDSAISTPTRAPVFERAEELDDARRALHGWAVQASGHFDGAARIEGPQCAKAFLELGGGRSISCIRMSTSTRASAATTLERVPPEITPGLTVIAALRFGE